MIMRLHEATSHVLKEKFGMDSITVLHGTLSTVEPQFDEESQMVYISPVGVDEGIIGEIKDVSYSMGVMGDLLDHCDSIALELELTSFETGKVSNAVQELPKEEVLQQSLEGPNFTISGRGPNFEVDKSMMICLILHMKFQDGHLIEKVNELLEGINAPVKYISMSTHIAEMRVIGREKDS